MRILLSLLLIISLQFNLAAQTKRTISGTIKDGSTGEALIGATIQIENTSISITSNAYGFFSLQTDILEPTVVVNFIGFKPLVFKANEDFKNKTIELFSIDNTLEEIEVNAFKKVNQITSPQMGVVKLNIDEIKNVPVIFGERDVLKTIQMLPGVGKGGEGSSNFYVRGGGGDQNLILLDEATVYNASHLLGFFSTFNSDAIKDVELYKGGIPAVYGGRISSVLDIHMKDGNYKKFSGEGGIGLIASRLKLEGPIEKDKSSFMLSGRRTYADLFLKLSNDESVNKSKLYFYDLNAKLNFRLNDKNTLYISGYFGKDDLGYSDLFTFDWGNKTSTVRLNHIFNPSLFSNTTLIYSDFNYNVNVNSESTEFKIASKIQNYNLKQDFSYYLSNNNTLKFGLNVLRQTISPASLRADIDADLNSIEIEKRKGIEAAAYLSHEVKIKNWFSAIYGARFTNFMVLGPGTFYNFDQDGEPSQENIFSNEIIKHYFNIEPRLSMSFILNSRNSIKFSYNRIVQNLHQLTNTTSSLPTDQYVMSSVNIKPQFADQVAGGYFTNLFDGKIDFSSEIFYKKMGNQIDFRNGADLQANKFLEGELLFGEGRSYGLELYLRKNSGKFNGWISYTLAKSERKFDNINNGNWFNARQDRTHDISIVAMYPLSKKWSIGSNFIYYTGNAVTFPSGKYVVDNKTMFYYTERNGYRMPSYHRLDISATYDKPQKSNKSYHSSWSFGFYNVYSRKNAYTIDFRENEDNSNITEAYKIALFGIIPSVTWNFKF